MKALYPAKYAVDGMDTSVSILTARILMYIGKSYQSDHFSFHVSQIFPYFINVSVIAIVNFPEYTEYPDCDSVCFSLYICYFCLCTITMVQELLAGSCEQFFHVVSA